MATLGTLPGPGPLAPRPGHGVAAHLARHAVGTQTVVLAGLLRPDTEGVGALAAARAVQQRRGGCGSAGANLATTLLIVALNT